MSTSSRRPEADDRPEIFLTPAEHEALSRLVGEFETTGPTGLLQQELERATVCEADDLPPDTVGLNRWLHYVDGGGAEPRRIRIVLPAEADIDAGRVSVLSYVGAGLIGLTEGQSITWPDPGGRLRRLTPVLVEARTAAP